MPDKPKKTADELRAELSRDPRTKDIAKTLGMGLDAYVEMVIDFALHPEKKPQLNLISEAEAKANGVATTAEVKGWFETQLQKLSGSKAPPKDEFEDTKSGVTKSAAKKKP